MSIRYFLFAAAALLSGFQASAEVAHYEFHVAPSVRSGRPYIKVKTNSMDGLLTVSVVELADQNSTSLLAEFPESKFHKACRIDLPRVEKDTYVEVDITTDPLALKPAFKWRTMIRNEDKPLIQYAGRKEMLPPKDFDTYWKRARNELGRVPLKPIVTPMPDKNTTTGLLYRVELPSVEETTVVCWYYVPRAAFDKNGKVRRRFPAVMISPGYGAEEPPLDRTTSGLITLSVNPRNHGPSREYWKAPVEHLLYNIEDPEHYYYKLAFLDCLRGAQFLFSRREVDSKRVATEGGSQGGLFAIATAALDKRIACVVSNVTAFSDYPDGMVLARKGHHSQFARLVSDNPASATLIRKSLEYTDGANMITRVHCPVQINMGGQDPVSPYICGIVTYNCIPDGVQREYHVTPDAHHEVTRDMRRNNAAWLSRWLKLTP